MLAERLKEIAMEFSTLPNDMLRYSFLVELSAYVPTTIPEIMQEEYRFTKCQSQVWIRLGSAQGAFQMQGTSDTLIIRGLLHVLMQLFNDCPLEEIAEQPIDIVALCGLSKQISGTRGDNIGFLLQEIQNFCRRESQQEGIHATN